MEVTYERDSKEQRDGDDERKAQERPIKRKLLQQNIHTIAQEDCSDPEAHQQTLPQTFPAVGVQLVIVLALFPFLRFPEALGGNVVEALIFNTKLAALCPEVLAVANDAQVERIGCLSRPRETVGGLTFGESIEA